MTSDPYDPTTALQGFQARRNLPLPRTSPPKPTPPARTPLRLVNNSRPTPITPFGSLIGNRVAAKALLPVDLNTRLRDHRNNSTNNATFGEIFIKAIAETWSDIAPQASATATTATGTQFPDVTIDDGRLTPNEPTIPVVFYLSQHQAKSVQAVREQLDNIEFGQLARIALDRYLAQTPA